mmetsp:Transcript_31414/g.106485  ORF Transcript_31414/g.106485 Transcript_31414/m.106485 type:complete len:206 (-) Transcript_31414:1513-2130(-)
MSSFAAWSGAMALRNVCVAPSFWSWTTAWRCVNVPRSTSCPVKRTGVPSSRSVPKASASPWAQSTPSPLATASAFFARMPLSRRCRLKPSGVVDSAALTFCRSSSATPVLPKAPWPTLSGDTISCQFWPQTSRSHLNASLLSNASAYTCSTEPTIAPTSSGLSLGSVTWTSATYFVSTDGCFLTTWYMVGCVNVGSSISLWPNFR